MPRVKTTKEICLDICRRVEGILKSHVNTFGEVVYELRDSNNYIDIYYNDPIAENQDLYSAYLDDFVDGSIDVKQVAHFFYENICKRNGWPITWDGE